MANRQHLPALVPSEPNGHSSCPRCRAVYFADQERACEDGDSTNFWQLPTGVVRSDLVPSSPQSMNPPYQEYQRETQPSPTSVFAFGGAEEHQQEGQFSSGELTYTRQDVIELAACVKRALLRTQVDS